MKDRGLQRQPEHMHLLAFFGQFGKVDLDACRPQQIDASPGRIADNDPRIVQDQAIRRPISHPGRDQFRAKFLIFLHGRINGGFHLVAFAGNESRDLGPIQQRDIKYVWAGSHGDVAGYFSNKDASDTIKTLLMY